MHTSTKAQVNIATKPEANRLVSSQGELTIPAKPEEIAMIGQMDACKRLTDDALLAPAVITDSGGLLRADGSDAVPWHNWDSMPGRNK